MFCPKCGTQLPDTAKMCFNCKVTFENNNAVEQAPVQPVQQAQFVQQAAPKKKKNFKLVFIPIIAIILVAAIVVGILFLNDNKKETTADSRKAEAVLAEYLSDTLVGEYGLYERTADQTGIISALVEESSLSLLTISKDDGVETVNLQTYVNKDGKPAKNFDLGVYSVNKDSFNEDSSFVVYKTEKDNKKYIITERLDISSSIFYNIKVFEYNDKETKVVNNIDYIMQSGSYELVTAKNVPSGLKMYADKDIDSDDIDEFSLGNIAYFTDFSKSYTDYYSDSISAIDALLKSYGVKRTQDIDDIRDYYESIFDTDDVIMDYDQYYDNEGGETVGSFTDHTNINSIVKDDKHEIVQGSIEFDKILDKIKVTDYINYTLLDKGSFCVDDADADIINMFAFAKALRDGDFEENTEDFYLYTLVDSKTMVQNVKYYFGDKAKLSKKDFTLYNVKDLLYFESYAMMECSQKVLYQSSEDNFKINRGGVGGGDLPFIYQYVSDIKVENDEIKIYVGRLYVDVSYNDIDYDFVYHFYKDFKNEKFDNLVATMNATDFFESSNFNYYNNIAGSLDVDGCDGKDVDTSCYTMKKGSDGEYYIYSFEANV